MMTSVGESIWQRLRQKQIGHSGLSKELVKILKIKPSGSSSTLHWFGRSWNSHLNCGPVRGEIPTDVGSGTKTSHKVHFKLPCRHGI